MKTVYYHYGNGVIASLQFSDDATLKTIALKIGTNAIIVKVE